jgi:signal transduction histidine kinase
MKPVITIQIVARTLLWLLVFSFESALSELLKHMPPTYLFHVALVGMAVLLFAITFCFDDSPLVQDIRELCFYDVLVQCMGLAMYFYYYNPPVLYALSYTVIALKFMRLLWPGRTAEGDGFISWPVFGVVGLYRKVRGNGTGSGASPQQDALAYAAMAATMTTISLLYLAGGKIGPLLPSLAFIAICLIAAFYKRIMAFMEEQEATRIASIEAIAVAKATASLNIELAAKNTALAEAGSVLAMRNDALAAAAKERALLIANIEQKNAMLCDAAHDLTRPLSLVSIQADVLIEAVCAMPAINADTRALRQSIDHLGVSIQDAIHKAKISTSITPPALTAFSVTQLMREWNEHYTPLCSQHGISFAIRPLFGNVDFHIAINEEIFNRILANLINNALLHSATKEIYLTLRKRGQVCVVGVWDTGCGIKGAAGMNGASNFNAFAQRIAIRTRNGYQGVGHGLGLNNVARLCISMDSIITLRSQPGRGTVFQFTVPLAGETLQTAAADARKYPARPPAFIQ